MSLSLRISSHLNPRFKAAIRLRDRRERRARGIFGVEGAREISRALSSGFVPKEVFQIEDSFSVEGTALIGRLKSDFGCPIYTVAKHIAAKLLVRDGSEGLFATFKYPETQLDTLRVASLDLILAVENLEKPGNLGALLRSADGAGVGAVVVIGQGIDPFSPNVIRSSLGTVFSVPVVTTSPSRFVEFCRTKGLQTVAATIGPNAKSSFEVDLSQPSAFILGTESTGLSPYWASHADLSVEIPMFGMADSLNVSVAGAILLYEARRQRSRSAAVRLSR